MSEPTTTPTVDVMYTGVDFQPGDEARTPIPGPAVQWFLRVRDRLAARGITLTPATRSRMAGASVLESEAFVIHCPVPGCAGLAMLSWSNNYLEQVRVGRRKTYRRVMMARLGACETSGSIEMQSRPRHTEAEMLAALGEDLAPFPPHAVEDGGAR